MRVEDFCWLAPELVQARRLPVRPRVAALDFVRWIGPYHPAFRLEEALRAGLPVLAIDPKGDMGNLLLAFPDLAADDSSDATRGWSGKVIQGLAAGVPVSDTPAVWNYAAFAGRFGEISAQHAGAQLTLAFRLVLEAQRRNGKGPLDAAVDGAAATVAGRVGAVPPGGVTLGASIIMK